jgi:hypothetical protein
MAFAEVSAIVGDAAMRGRILGVRLPLEDEDKNAARNQQIIADMQKWLTSA